MYTLCLIVSPSLVHESEQKSQSIYICIWILAAKVPFMDKRHTNFSLKSMLCHLFCTTRNLHVHVSYAIRNVFHVIFLLSSTEASFHLSRHVSWGGLCPLSATQTESVRRRLVGGAWSCGPRQERRTWICTSSRAGQSLAALRPEGLGKTLPVSIWSSRLPPPSKVFLSFHFSLILSWFWYSRFPWADQREHSGSP